MTDKPVLLLDIDGVVNAMSKKVPVKVWPADVWHWTKVQAPDGGQYPIFWATPVVDWLTRLHESGDVEIRWHSTWQEASLEVGEAVGLPVFKVHECPEYAEGHANGSALVARLLREGLPRWWKYPAAERVLTDEGSRTIWIDDDIDYQLSASTRRTLEAVYNIELVCPDERTGLMPKHMRRVDAVILDWKENPGGALSGS